MGLQAKDLKHTVYNVFEIDNYQSKLGSDEDISVLSFSVSGKDPATDLMSFLEKGYEFILDADVTSSEQSDGTYKVFVEIDRTKDLPNQIAEVADGVRKLADIENLKFRYYKNFKSYSVTEDNINQVVPLDSSAYTIAKDGIQLENYKNFFNRSYVDDIDMLEDTLTIKKKYADPVAFEFVDFGSKTEILENLNETINVNDFAEIIFLSKYIGDYNITKFGDYLTFENDDKLLVTRRK